MKVYINNGKARKVVDVTLVKRNRTTIRVQLPDGCTIQRDRFRDVYDWEDTPPWETKNVKSHQ